MQIGAGEYAFGTPADGLVDEFYGTASPMVNVVPGKDTMSCYDVNSFELIGRSVIGTAVECTQQI